MNAHTSGCDHQRIDDFLNSDHVGLDDSQLVDHLDSCAACREYMERQAGEPERWSKAAEILQPGEFDHAGSAEYSAATIGYQRVAQPVAIQNVLDSLSPSDDPHRLGRLEGYEVSGVVGAGGMGVVLKVVDPSLDRVVAIKVMAPHLANNATARKRFSREAKAAAAVLHPNVIPIHCVSSDAAIPYLVMAYIRGGSLQKRLEREGPVPTVEVLRIGAQIAAGLAAAHEQGLIHRDVKPENILLEEGVERVTLTDFGLARAVDDVSVTQHGMIAGTPEYMSPEQARGESVDQKSDLFSLGSVLYALCTGRPPFRADSSYGVMRRITDEEPRPIRQLNPDIPQWLCRIIARLMSKQPEERHESAHEVAELLEECLAHVQQPTAVPLPASLVRLSRGSRFFSISPRSLGIIVMTATFGLLLGMVLWQAAEAPDSNEPRSTPGLADAQTRPAELPPKTTAAMPKRVRRFTTAPGVKTPHSVTIAYSADGKLIAIANGNPTITAQGGGMMRAKDNWKPSVDILDAKTGKTVVSLKLSTDDVDALIAATKRVSHFEVNALAFSPDGSLLAVGTSIGQVKLFNTRTGLDSSSVQIGDLVRSLDDKKAKLADKRTPKNWQSPRRAMGRVASLAFSFDGSLLAVCGDSFGDFSIRFDPVARTRATVKTTGPGRLKVWEVKTGTLKHDLDGYSHAHAVAFSPDGNLLACAGQWRSKSGGGSGVRIWNPHTGTTMRILTTDVNVSSGAWSVAFSPDSELVAIGSQRFFDKHGIRDAGSGGVSLTHVSSGVTQWLQTVPGSARRVAFSPDGKSVAVLRGRRSIRFLETEKGRLMHEIPSADSPQAGRWTDFAIAPQAHMLAIGGVGERPLAGFLRKGSVELWDLDGHGTAANSAPVKNGEN